MRAYEIEQYQHRGNILRNDGGDGNARHAHAEEGNGDDIQDDVDHACQRQIVQGALGIAHRAHDGGAEVIEHIARHAQEINAHIQGSTIQHVPFRRTHPHQEGMRHEQAKDAHQHAHDQAEGDGRMHRVLYFPILVRAAVLRYQHAGTNGQADEQVDHQRNQRRSCRYRGNGIRAFKLPHNHHVGHVVQKLQHAGKDQRDGIANHVRKDRAVHHVDLTMCVMR